MSQGRKFSVYSKFSDARIHRASLDLDALEKGAHRPHSVPPAAPATLPAWVQEYARQFVPSFLRSSGHGTVVVLEHLDNLTWKTAVALERNLDRALGVGLAPELDRRHPPRFHGHTGRA